MKTYLDEYKNNLKYLKNKETEIGPTLQWISSFNKTRNR